MFRLEEPRLALNIINAVYFRERKGWIQHSSLNADFFLHVNLAMLSARSGAPELAL